MNKTYAIVDLETTGGRAERDKITEIGIVIFDGKEITETYSTLVNPGRSIPYNITRITGIDDQMVEDAPYFYEVAKKVVELTKGCIFVAHNVRFDYGFLKHEFSELGYTFTRKTLDTVRLSRQAFPGLRSYSLGNLIKHFDIKVAARHRALDDAIATTDVFNRIIHQDYGIQKINQVINKGIKATNLPKSLSLETIENLPVLPGVYYFYNSLGKIVYIGKSINIKKRVTQHFSKITKKSTKMFHSVVDITCEIAGNELIALLHESHEIKAYQPEINRAQKNRAYPYFVHYFYDAHGYINFAYLKSNKKNRQHKTILGEYSSRPAALSDLTRASEQLNLCHQKMGVQPGQKPCFLYSIEKCFGACIQEESAEEYNERATIALDLMKKIFDENFILILKGRSPDEKSIVLVEDGNYKGFGYMLNDDLDRGIEEMKEAINYVPFNQNSNQIIKGYLCNHPLTQKITF